MFFTRKIPSPLVTVATGRTRVQSLKATVTAMSVVLGGVVVPTLLGNHAPTAAAAGVDVQAGPVVSGGLIKRDDWKQSYVLGAVPAPPQGDKDSPEHVKNTVERSVKITRVGEENESLQQRWRITFNKDLIRDNTGTSWGGNRDVKYSVVLSPDYQVVGDVSYQLQSRDGSKTATRQVPATVMGSGDYGLFYNGIGQSSNTFAKLIGSSSRLVELRYFGQYRPTRLFNNRSQQVFNPPQQVTGTSLTRISSDLANQLSDQLAGTDRRGDQLWENVQWKDDRFQGWYVEDGQWPAGKFADRFGPNAGMAWSFSYATENAWADDVVTVEFTTQRDPSTMWYAYNQAQPVHRTFVAATYKAFLGANALVQRAAAQYVEMNDNSTEAVSGNGLPQRINVGVGIPVVNTANGRVSNNYDADDSADSDEVSPQGLGGFVVHKYLNLAEVNPVQTGGKVQPAWGIDGSDPTVGYAGYILMPNQTKTIEANYNPTGSNVLQYVTEPNKTVQLWDTGVTGKLLAETKSDDNGLARLQIGWGFSRNETGYSWDFQPNQYGNNVALNADGSPKYVRTLPDGSITLRNLGYQLKVYSEGWDTLPAYPQVNRPIFARPATETFQFNGFTADAQKTTLTATPGTLAASKSAKTILRLSLRTADGKPISVQPDDFNLEQYQGVTKTGAGLVTDNQWRAVAPGTYELSVGNTIAGQYRYRVTVNQPNGQALVAKDVNVTFTDSELTDATISGLAEAYPAGLDVNNLTISAQGKTSGGFTGDFWVKIPGRQDLVKLSTQNGAPVAIPAFKATKKDREIRVYADAQGTNLIKTVPTNVHLGGSYNSPITLSAYGSILTNAARVRKGTQVTATLDARDYDGDPITGQTGFALLNAPETQRYFVEDPNHPGRYTVVRTIEDSTAFVLDGSNKTLVQEPGSTTAVLAREPNQYRLAWIDEPIPFGSNVGGKKVKVVDATSWKPVPNHTFKAYFNGNCVNNCTEVSTDADGIISLPSKWNGLDWRGSVPSVVLINRATANSDAFKLANIYDSIPVQVQSEQLPAQGTVSLKGNLEVDKQSGLAVAGVNQKVTVFYQANASEIGGLDYAEVKATLNGQTVTLTAAPTLAQNGFRTYQGQLTAPANGGDYEVSTTVNDLPGQSAYLQVKGTETPAVVKLVMTKDKALQLAVTNNDAATANIVLKQMDGLTFETYTGVGSQASKEATISNAQGFSSASTRNIPVLPGWQFRVTAEAAGKGLSRPIVATVQPPKPEITSISLSEDRTKVIVKGNIAYPGNIAVSGGDVNNPVEGVGGVSAQLPAGDFTVEFPVAKDFKGNINTVLQAYGANSEPETQQLAAAPKPPVIQSAQLNGNGEAIVTVNSPSAGKLTVNGVTVDVAAGETKTITVPASANINADQLITATVVNDGGSATSAQFKVTAAPGAPTATEIKHVGSKVSFKVTAPQGGTLKVMNNGAVVKTIDNLTDNQQVDVELPNAGTGAVTYSLISEKDGVSSTAGTVAVKALPTGPRFTYSVIEDGKIKITGTMPVEGKLKFIQQQPGKKPITWESSDLPQGALNTEMEAPAGVTSLSSGAANSTNTVVIAQTVDGQYLESEPSVYSLARKLAAPTISSMQWNKDGKLLVTVTGVEPGTTVALKQDTGRVETQIAAKEATGTSVKFELTADQVAGIPQIFAKQDQPNDVLVRTSGPSDSKTVPAQPVLSNIDVYVDKDGVHVAATPNVVGTIKVTGQADATAEAGTPYTTTFARGDKGAITLSLATADGSVSPDYTFNLADAPEKPSIATEIKHNSPNEVALKVTPNNDSGTLVIYRQDGATWVNVAEQEFSSKAVIDINVPDGGQLMPHYLAEIRKTLDSRETQTRLISERSNEVTAPQMPLAPSYTLKADGDHWNLEVTMREAGALAVENSDRTDATSMNGSTTNNLKSGIAIRYTLPSDGGKNTAGKPITIAVTTDKGTFTLKPELPTPPSQPTDFNFTTDQSPRNNFDEFGLNAHVDGAQDGKLKAIVQFWDKNRKKYFDMTVVEPLSVPTDGNLHKTIHVGTKPDKLRLVVVDADGNRSVPSAEQTSVRIKNEFTSGVFKYGSTTEIKLEYAESLDVIGVQVRDENDNKVGGVTFDSVAKTVTLPAAGQPGDKYFVSRVDTHGNVSDRYDVVLPGRTPAPTVTDVRFSESGNWYSAARATSPTQAREVSSDVSEVLKPSLIIRTSGKIPEDASFVVRKTQDTDSQVLASGASTGMRGRYKLPLSDNVLVSDIPAEVAVTMVANDMPESRPTTAMASRLAIPQVNSAYLEGQALKIVGHSEISGKLLVEVTTGKSTKYYAVEHNYSDEDESTSGFTINISDSDANTRSQVRVAAGSVILTSAWSGSLTVADDSVVTTWSNTSATLLAGQTLSSLHVTGKKTDGTAVTGTPTLKILIGDQEVYNHSVYASILATGTELTFDTPQEMQPGTKITVQQLKDGKVVSTYPVTNVEVLSVDAGTLKVTKTGQDTNVSTVSADDPVTVQYTLPAGLPTKKGLKAIFKLVPKDGSEAIWTSGDEVDLSSDSGHVDIPSKTLKSGEFKLIPVVNGVEGTGKTLTVNSGAAAKFTLPDGTKLVNKHDNYVPITVTDSAGNLVKDTTVYFTLDNGNRIAVVTDQEGKAIVPLQPSLDSARDRVTLEVCSDTEQQCTGATEVAVVAADNTDVAQHKGTGQLVITQANGTALAIDKEITVGSTVGATYTYTLTDQENGQLVIPNSVTVQLGDGTKVAMVRQSVDAANKQVVFAIKKLVAPTTAADNVSAQVTHDLSATPETFAGYKLVADKPTKLVLADPATHLVKGEADQQVKVKITDQYGNVVTPTGLTANGPGLTSDTTLGTADNGVYTIDGLQPSDADNTLTITGSGGDSLSLELPLVSRVDNKTGTLTVSDVDTVGQDLPVTYQLPTVGAGEVITKPEQVHVKVVDPAGTEKVVDLRWDSVQQAYVGTVPGADLKKAGHYTITPVIDGTDVTGNQATKDLRPGVATGVQLVDNNLKLTVGEEQTGVRVKFVDAFGNTIAKQNSGQANVTVTVGATGTAQSVLLADDGTVILPAFTPAGTAVPVLVTVGANSAALQLKAYTKVDNTTGSFSLAGHGTWPDSVPSAQKVTVKYTLPAVNADSEVIDQPDQLVLYVDGKDVGVKLTKSGTSNVYTGQYTPTEAGKVSFAVGTTDAATKQDLKIVTGALNNNSVVKSDLVKDLYGSVTFKLLDNNGNPAPDGINITVKVDGKELPAATKDGILTVFFTPSRAGIMPAVLEIADQEVTINLTVQDRQPMTDGQLSISAESLTTDIENPAATWTLNDLGDRVRGDIGRVELKAGDTVIATLEPVTDETTRQFTGKFTGQIDNSKPVSGLLTVVTADGDVAQGKDLKIAVGAVAKAELVEPDHGYVLLDQDTPVQLKLTDAKGNEIPVTTAVKLEVAGAAATTADQQVQNGGVVNVKVNPAAEGDVIVTATVNGKTVAATLHAVAHLPISAGDFTINGSEADSSAEVGSDLQLGYTLPEGFDADDLVTIYPVVNGNVLVDQPLKRQEDGTYQLSLPAPSELGATSYHLAFDKEDKVHTKNVTVAVTPAAAAKVERVGTTGLVDGEANKVQFKVTDAAGQPTTHPVWVKAADGKFAQFTPNAEGIIELEVTPQGKDVAVVVAADEAGKDKLYEQNIGLKSVPKAAADMQATQDATGKVTVSGVTTPGATVVVKVPGSEQPVTVVADPETGKFEVVVPGAKVGDELEVTPVLDGVAGETTSVTVKSVPKAAADMQATQDATGKVTVSGVTTPGATVVVKVPGSEQPVTVVADPETGKFEVVVPGAKVGDELEVTPVLDGVAGETTNVTVKPAAPQISITGHVLSGTAVPGATVSVRDQSGNVLGVVEVGESGKFTVTLPPTTTGTLTVVASVDGVEGDATEIEHQADDQNPKDDDTVNDEPESTPPAADKCTSGSAGSSCGSNWLWLIPVVLIALGLMSYVQYTSMVDGGDRQPLQRGQGNPGDWIRWLQGLPARV